MSNFKPILILSLFVLFMVSLGAISAEDVNVTVIPESDYSSKLNQMVATGDNSIDIYIIWENDIKNFP